MSGETGKAHSVTPSDIITSVGAIFRMPLLPKDRKKEKLHSDVKCEEDTREVTRSQRSALISFKCKLMHRL